ncbi:MAG: c-type cytochrome [Planctomycetaceae bacterium]
MIRLISIALTVGFTGGYTAIAADDFPEPVNTQAAGEHPPTPREMLELFELPEGFQVKLFAGEPDVQQPIAFDFDDAGRIWVAENYTYSSHGKIDPNLRDRVIILHDKDGDGEHDERKVFWDKGSMLTGLTWGYGGLWILNDGTLSFIPDKNGDDIPDSEPVEMLNGWTKNAGHNFVSGLLWGPDGWLYGRHGITDTSYPGTPDTPKEERQPINCGIWRFHPTKHTFEVVCHGTTNPWGLDYNEYGDMFMTNNVIGHLWHVIPGAHYERMFGQDFNPHLYELMPQIADHYHWDTTGKWADSRDGKADDLGGGHSHCGGMIYYGDNFPEEYRGKIFMCNTHGRCVNVNRLERKGSTYVGKREPNFLKVNTPWFRGVELKYGPRGCVYLTDWSDNGECHDHDGVHRTSGRIYRISYGEPRPTKYEGQNVGTFSTQTLINIAGVDPMDGFEWHRRHARRLVSERNVGEADRRISASALDQQLSRLLEAESLSLHSLSAAQLLGSLDLLTDAQVSALMNSESEWLRRFAVRHLGNSQERPSEAMMDNVRRLAEAETSLPVLMELAHFRYLDFPLWTTVAEKRSGHSDNQLTLMLWYSAEPFVGSLRMPDIAMNFNVASKLQSFCARRLAAEPKSFEGLDHSAMVALLQNGVAHNSATTEYQVRILDGIIAGLTGRTRQPPPALWDTWRDSIRVDAPAEVVERIRTLDVLFGSGAALEDLRNLLADREGDHTSRSRAVAALAQAGDVKSIPVFLSLLTDRAVYADVARALAAFDDPRIPNELLKRWDNLRHGSQEAAMDTLISRKSYALELMKAIDKGQVDSAALTASQVRQLISFNEPQITEIVEARWGVINESSEAKETAISSWKEKLTVDVLATANLEAGAALFKKSCANCHKLYGEGGKIGPDLTGANRNNLLYVLSNIIDPSAEVPRQFTMSVIALKSGRVITGVIIGETEQVLTVQTDKEQLAVAVADVEERSRTTKSLMPDGLLDSLTEQQVIDLIAFVQQRR